jgi:hypothetical protein
MFIAHFLETHGIEVVLGYIVFASIVSTMPPLPQNAGYWAKWAFGLLHVLASDWKQVLEIAKIPAFGVDSKTVVENVNTNDTNTKT